MFEFKLLTVELFFLSLSVLNSDLFEGVVISFIVVELLLIEVDDLVACNVEELSGVGHNNDGVFTVCNVVFEPHNGVQI